MGLHQALLYDYSTKELADMAKEWNRHLLSPNRKNTPSGRPDVLYFLPHFYVTVNHMISIDTDFSDEFGELTETLINENRMEMSYDASSAFDVYLYPFSEIEEYS